MKVFKVQPARDGGWIVQEEGKSITQTILNNRRKYFNKKKVAENYGRNIARNNPPSKVIVLRMDGSTQYSKKYER